MRRLTLGLLIVCLSTGGMKALGVETLRHPPSLEHRLRDVPPEELAREARRRGDPRRGALVFYKSAAACVNCHPGGADTSPLGPDLARLGDVSDTHIVESLLEPSKSIREGYRTRSILTAGGEVLVGMVVARDDATLTLRVASDLSHDRVIPVDQVDQIRDNDRSMMPTGLVASIGDQRDFYDLVRYVIEVASGGPERAAELKPSEAQLAIKDDTADLDHAGIIRGLKSRDFDAGKAIYHGYCFNCHGNDGNTPSLPTARAFGTQKLRFGSDPYRMFMTLSLGNGLMAPMTHLTPRERYQVVHYVRERFMKESNPDYFRVDDVYLAGLPAGTEDGTRTDPVRRDFGPALASQLWRRFSSALTVKLDQGTIAYDLHTMNQAAVWRGGFLDLSETQHVRDRGEGTAVPDGREVGALAGWQWGHEGTLDYPRQGLRPRGPLPESWMRYRGHHLSGDRVILDYEIDGRQILELPRWNLDGVTHSLRIGPGRGLVLAVARGHGDRSATAGVSRWENLPQHDRRGPAEGSVIFSRSGAGDAVEECVAATVRGDTEGLTWSIDAQGRLRLDLPADDRVRHVDIIRRAAEGDVAFAEWIEGLSDAAAPMSRPRPEELFDGGPLRWPQVLSTVGVPGLEQGAYALDTLTLPDSTPWNTWFRTSAIDFFADGRMAVATYGGDVWIVSGIDEKLLELRWKRYASGLYEPFGLKIVDGDIFVTCKDRLTRLHDVNDDGEADFYESFSADDDVSVNFHAFNFDLQTDPEGSFYYAKSGHGSDSDLPGAVIKVSPDGRYREVYCTGFRTPNGMGVLPDGRLTASDNQGQWTPASKISVVRPGGFYGWVPTYSIPGMWEPGGGSIDVNQVAPPETFDPPLVWMPQEFDNSSGGHVWADDPRWGPLSGHLLHTSFGKGWMSYLMIQDVDEVAQAAVIKLPFDFRTGIMRARINPADGQVYATGLQGWNGGGRIGLLGGGIERLRYTGKPGHFVTDCRVEADGLAIRFNFPLDPDAATNPDSYRGQQWNYRWQAAYGSDQYSPTTGEVGVDRLNVRSASIGTDGRTVHLKVLDLRPVDQLHLVLRLRAADGTDIEEEIYWTIHRVPKQD